MRRPTKFDKLRTASTKPDATDQPPLVPGWVDHIEYPFDAHTFHTGDGKMHYVDEGKGDPILFVHGTPTWSFLYRNYIKALSNRFRCIAPDHLGFGLSEKDPAFQGTPDWHSQRLEELVEHLNLKGITLVVHDFGGPIGLSFAIRRPELVKRVVLFNTWLWETANDKGARRINALLHSKLGNFLYTRTNFAPGFLLPNAFANRKKLSKPIKLQYTSPFSSRDERQGLLRIGQALVGASTWYAEQWKKISLLQSKPFLLLWGMKDPFIGSKYLQRWKDHLQNLEAHEFPAGHFVQEECGEATCQILERWLISSAD